LVAVHVYRGRIPDAPAYSFLFRINPSSYTHIKDNGGSKGLVRDVMVKEPEYPFIAPFNVESILQYYLA